MQTEDDLDQREMQKGGPPELPLLHLASGTCLVTNFDGSTLAEPPETSGRLYCVEGTRPVGRGRCHLRPLAEVSCVPCAEMRSEREIVAFVPAHTFAADVVLAVVVEAKEP